MKARQDQSQHEEEDIHILDLLVVIAKYKKSIIGTTLVAAALVAGISMAMPNIYTASAKILPPQQSQSAATMILGQLGSLGGLAGNSLGIKNPADIYVGMLGSRTVGDRLIKRFELDRVYETTFHSDTLKVLAGVSTFAAGKDGLISIDVDDTDPKRAAGLANGYVEELQRLMSELALSDAAQRRVFFEQQLKQAKLNLAESEVALKKVQEKTGLIRPEGQAEVLIVAAANLRAQIAAKEVQLGAMRTFATGNNPEYIRLQEELNGLRAQLSKAETGVNAGKGDIGVATSRMPEVGLEYVRKLRDVKYNEAIFEVLAKQFEIAKLDEAKDRGVLQILDKAVEPDRKSKPKRTIMVFLGALIAGFIAVCRAFYKEWKDGVASRVGSQEHQRLMDLRKNLRWKSR
ncbi:GumC family protein [Massilia putida]|uniref:GumC family protein n=1 Tax=Massilia putida TaxID=1141883 RepID=UPI0009512AD7|nr:GNVR domain-containing protein [Massilia putida]